MKKLILLTGLISCVLSGCASTHKLTQPKGRWQAINQAGFIPVTAERFYEEMMTQAKAEAAAEVLSNHHEQAAEPITPEVNTVETNQ